jgi:clamp loader A subunit
MALELNKNIESPVIDVPEEKEEKKQNLFIPFLKSIHNTKNNMLDESSGMNPELVEKEYKKYAYIINRNLSNFPDTIFYAQAMNMRSSLDGKMQYLFQLYGVPKRNRFAKSEKVEDPENLEIIKEYYGFSSKKARTALEILSDEDIEYIKTKLFKGGLAKKKTKEK